MVGTYRLPPIVPFVELLPRSQLYITMSLHATCAAPEFVTLDFVHADLLLEKIL